jgi:glycosyltransferase involved in cell wall biosynthesis
MKTLGVVRDFRAEGWASMDLCADELHAHWPKLDFELQAVDVEPNFRRWFSDLPIIAGRRPAFNADRLVNRHWSLPQHMRRRRHEFDAYHIVDHSYAHVALSLPKGRVGVYCHDLDAFRCLLDPSAEPRPRWFRSLAWWTLEGMQKAAVVFHSTHAVREAILKHGLADPARLVHAPYGTSREFTLDGAFYRRVDDRPYIAHVGSCIPRKRIDVLLKVVAALRESNPELSLVKVGGEWTPTQHELIDELGLRNSIAHLTGLTRADVASVYRGAAAVLVTSDAEGFGLPVIEALACGAPVIASDIPVLREVGGEAVRYAPVGDVPSWAAMVRVVLAGAAPPRADRLAHASRYSWTAHAETIAAAYRRILA